MPLSKGGETLKVTSSRWLGSPIIYRPARKLAIPPRIHTFDRQQILLGSEGQKMLYSTTLGVVGSGGGGSHVVEQAAYAGFGRLILVDPDSIEDSNLSRLIGANPKDIQKLKVDVLGKHAKVINPDVRIEKVPERFPSENGISALKKSDIVIGCLDTYHARQELLKFCWRNLIPLIDIGVGIILGSGTPKKAKRVEGHVHVYLPGGPCMWCTHLLSQERLNAEDGGRGPEYMEGAVSPAQVVSFNGAVASLALIEAMQLTTGFLERESASSFQQYNALKHSLVEMFPAKRESCNFCNSELGKGDSTWE